MKSKNALQLLFLLTLMIMSSGASAERIKDVASVAGVRANQLLGYGLVVGLDGTGDSSSQPFTVQSLTNMLAQLGVVVPPNVAVGQKAVVTGDREYALPDLVLQQPRELRRGDMAACLAIPTT